MDVEQEYKLLAEENLASSFRSRWIKNKDIFAWRFFIFAVILSFMIIGAFDAQEKPWVELAIFLVIGILAFWLYKFADFATGHFRFV